MANALSPLRRLHAANALLLLKVQELQEELRATQEGLEDGGEAAEPEREEAAETEEEDASTAATAQSDASALVHSSGRGSRKQRRTQSRQDPTPSTRRSSKRVA